MALTAEERTLYETRLADAENAYHLIMTGQQAKVYVDQNGERVEYQAGSVDRLRAYIHQLKLALGKVSVTGPLNMWI